MQRRHLCNRCQESASVQAGWQAAKSVGCNDPIEGKAFKVLCTDTQTKGLATYALSTTNAPLGFIGLGGAGGEIGV